MLRIIFVMCKVSVLGPVVFCDFFKGALAGCGAVFIPAIAAAAMSDRKRMRAVATQTTLLSLSLKRVDGWTSRSLGK